MFTIDQAESILASRVVDIDARTGGVNLVGRWRLHELEALCAMIRHVTDNQVDGVEDHITRRAIPINIMPYPKLEALVRAYNRKITKALVLTMRENVAQLSNPGSQTVYGRPVATPRGIGVAFKQEKIRELTVMEVKIKINEMCAELKQLGCSMSTRIVASAMLLSWVTYKEQEEAITEFEQAYLKPQE